MPAEPQPHPHPSMAQLPLRRPNATPCRVGSPTRIARISPFSPSPVSSWAAASRSRSSTMPWRRSAPPSQRFRRRKRPLRRPRLPPNRERPPRPRGRRDRHRLHHRPCRPGGRRRRVCRLARRSGRSPCSAGVPERTPKPMPPERGLRESGRRLPSARTRCWRAESRPLPGSQ